MALRVSAMKSKASRSAAPLRSRRWLLALLFLGWTAFAAIAVTWLLGLAAEAGNTVIRLGPEEAKSWGVRMRETLALARLNFPWAMAWFFLTPYAVWVGVRYSFEVPRWRTRLPVLLAAGTAFVCASQWLSQRLVAGQAMIVMVKYTADATMQRLAASGENLAESWPRNPAASHLATNRITKVMISGEHVTPTNQTDLEIATAGLLAGLDKNLPHLLAAHAVKDLPSPRPLRSNRGSAVLDALAFVALIGLAHAGVFHRRYRERDQQAALLESRLNQARLRALQAQLQPHFLFNSLNGIATLLRRDPATAGEMLVSLSELLRIALSTSDRQEIPLREELDFLGRYLAIQRMRFGDRLEVSQHVDPAALDCLVPALLLQPLVENAIRHGLEPSGQPGHLRIAAARHGASLQLTVEDDGIGLTAGDRTAQARGSAWRMCASGWPCCTPGHTNSASPNGPRAVSPSISACQPERKRPWKTRMGTSSHEPASADRGRRTAGPRRRAHVFGRGARCGGRGRVCRRRRRRQSH